MAGNLLEVKSATGESLIVISQSGWEGLTADNKKRLAKHGRILSPQIKTIEAIGGGSARCMMAEIFLPERSEIQ